MATGELGACTTMEANHHSKASQVCVLLSTSCWNGLVRERMETSCFFPMKYGINFKEWRLETMFFFEWNLLKYGGYSKHVSMFNSRGDVGCGWFIAAISGKFELVCGSGFDAISFFKGGIYREPRFSHHIWQYGGVMCCPVSMFPSFLGEMLEGTEAAMTARHERIHGWLQYPANGFPDLRTGMAQNGKHNYLGQNSQSNPILQLLLSSPCF